MKINKLRNNRGIEKFVFLNYLVIFFVVLGFCATLFFLYQNIYKTIDTGQNHVLIKINPDFEPINFELYEETLKNWEKKISKDTVCINRDPFYDVYMTSTDFIINIEENVLSNINEDRLNNVEILL